MNSNSTLNQETMTEYVRVPYGKAVYDQDEIDAVVKAMQNSTQMGPSVDLMEQKISDLFGKKYGLMVNSGSSANYLAIEVLNLPPGSEVITPVLTFSTTVAPLVRNKLVPVFVDVEEGTYNIDANKIESLITDKTKALMIPNLIGNLPNWEMLRFIADRHHLILIEDSADTVGATFNEIPTGKYADISTTSFYGSHVVSCAGNGGMICFNDVELLKKAKLLRSWGRSSSLFVESEKIENRFDVHLDGIQYDNKFVFKQFGYNLEPSEIGAAFGLVQLKKLEANIKLREQWFNKHTAFLKQYENWFILPKQLEQSRTGWLAYPIVIKDDAPFKRTELQIFLENRNIQTRTVFTGNILRQPCFTQSDLKYKRQAEDFIHADSVMRGGMLIACHNGLSKEMFDHVQNSIQLFCSCYTK
ncbi:MAG: dTDP-4-dehydro-2,6-dideoxy-D-glucose 3-dehydratase [Chlamydiae bacterium]|nr:dTDP-4-dehydro-2,6-dideoxy-D-glucose 3-dehydratase [Chlamydiota bacterium]